MLSDMVDHPVEKEFLGRQAARVDGTFEGKGRRSDGIGFWEEKARSTAAVWFLSLSSLANASARFFSHWASLASSAVIARRSASGFVMGQRTKP
jgi:hypothetical protein